MRCQELLLRGATVMGVASAESFSSVVTAIIAVLPAEAEVIAVEIAGDGAVVTLWTTTLAPCIGRRGQTAERTRDAVGAALGRQVDYRVEEAETSDEVVPSGRTEVVDWSEYLPPRPRLTRRHPSGWRTPGSVS